MTLHVTATVCSGTTPQHREPWVHIQKTVGTLIRVSCLHFPQLLQRPSDQCSNSGINEYEQNRHNNQYIVLYEGVEEVAIEEETGGERCLRWVGREDRCSETEEKKKKRKR
ncbi:hypothetical protein ILYODFUR_035598 [Ilyodon furcidens]|uniref:Uncharacterized protein n=1 Tax=Ilyodon furcidens TaxID=33524 RepID=A0ABV0UDT7_9TELE